LFEFEHIFKGIYSCDGKAEFSVSLLQSSVSHDPSEMILICLFAAPDTFENSLMYCTERSKEHSGLLLLVVDACVPQMQLCYLVTLKLNLLFRVHETVPFTPPSFSYLPFHLQDLWEYRQTVSQVHLGPYFHSRWPYFTCGLFTMQDSLNPEWTQSWITVFMELSQVFMKGICLH